MARTHVRRLLAVTAAAGTLAGCASTSTAGLGDAGMVLDFDAPPRPDAFVPEATDTGVVGSRDAGLPDGVPSAGRDGQYDFDGDGLGDAFVGDPDYRAGRGALWILRGSRDGAVVPALIAEGRPLEGLGAFVFHVGDRDGDGRREIAAMGRPQGAGSEWWARGRWIGSRGGGGAVAPLGPSTGPGVSGRNEVWSVDVDGDDMPDVVARRCWEGGWIDGGGGCSEYNVFTAAGESRLGAHVLADVNGDARSDVVRVSSDGLAIVVSDGGADRIIALDVGPIGIVYSAGDVDGDDREDLLATAADGRSSVVVRVHDVGVELTPLGAAVSFHGDVDCDGFDDLREGALLVRGGPDGPTRTSESAPGDFSSAGLVADLNGDGCRDRVDGRSIHHGRAGGSFDSPVSVELPPSEGRASRLFFADGSLWGWAGPQSFQRTAEGEVVFVDEIPTQGSERGDVDGDGFADRFSSDRMFWRGRAGGFDATDIVLGEYPWFPRLVGDVDADGDVEVAMRVDGGFTLLGGGPIFPHEDVVGRGTGLETVSGVAIDASAAGDVDGDGRSDVLAARVWAMDTKLWLGVDLIAGMRAPSATFPGWLFPSGDLDGDGIDDLVAGATAVGDREALIYLGRPGAAPSAIPIVLPLSAGESWGPGGVILSIGPGSDSLQLHRWTLAGVVPWGGSIVVPERGDGWMWIEPGPNALYLPNGHPDGGRLSRLAEDRPDEGTLIAMPPGSLERQLVTTSSVASPQLYFGPRGRT